MEGANADNVRPPAAQARSNSKAKTVHSQAPTMTSVRQETDDSPESTSSGAKSDQEGGDHPPEPPKTWLLEKAGRFLSKTLPPPRTSQTPAREKQTPAREQTHPLHTEGLDHIVIEDAKKGTNPKGRDKFKGPETYRRPRRQDPAPRKRDPSAHKRSNKDRPP